MAVEVEIIVLQVDLVPQANLVHQANLLLLQVEEVEIILQYLLSTPTVSAPTYSGGEQNLETDSLGNKILPNNDELEGMVLTEYFKQKNINEGNLKGDDAKLNYLTGDYQDINLTPEQKEQFSDYREGVSESIAPSTKTSSKIISALLSSTLFPFAGNLYNKYIDATAMGYSIPNPFEGLFDGGNITPESIQNFQDKGGDEQQALINNAISQSPFDITGTTPQDSMVNQYFANQPTSNLLFQF